MVLKKPNDVFAEVERYSLVFRAMGLFSLVYSLGEFRPSYRWLTSSLFTLWPFLVYNIYSAYLRWVHIDDNALYSYMGLAQVLFVSLGVMAAWILNRIKLDTLNKSLRKIQVVDYYLFSIGEQIPPSKPSKVILSVIATMIFTYFLRVYTYKSYYLYALTFASYYPYIMMSMVHLLLDRMCIILFLRYQAITNSLRRCLSLQGKKAEVLSEKMIFCYESLCSSGEKLNDLFSIHILSILTTVFIISFSEAYAAINLFYDEQTIVDKKSYQLTAKLCWSTITFLTIWQFGYRFSSITNKAKDFNSLLYQLMIEDRTSEILYNEKLRLHITMKREAVFTACGLFKLDYTLVHSMIASATTYLVILIQIGQLSSNGSVTTAPTSYINVSSTPPMGLSTNYN